MYSQRGEHLVLVAVMADVISVAMAEEQRVFRGIIVMIIVDRSPIFVER